MKKVLALVNEEENINYKRILLEKGLETVFAETGQTVMAGDAIGTVGDDLPFESAEEPHLHLEVIKDGRRIDPLSIIG